MYTRRYSMRTLVFLAQGGRCFYCKSSIRNFGTAIKRGSRRKLVTGLRHSSIDHVMPCSRGGDDTWSNKVIACLYCNLKKGDRLPTNEELNKLTMLRNEIYAVMENPKYYFDIVIGNSKTKRKQLLHNNDLTHYTYVMREYNSADLEKKLKILQRMIEKRGVQNLNWKQIMNFIKGND